MKRHLGLLVLSSTIALLFHRGAMATTGSAGPVTSLAVVGDVNGDGRADFAVGASGMGMGVPKLVGRCTVHSGKDGSVLLSFAGSGIGDSFGRSVTGPGDVNGDGHADIAVGAPDWNGRGVVAMFSGKDGSRLWEYGGEEGDRQVGASIISLGDLDGDRVPDLVLGAPLSPCDAGSRGGLVRGVSGRDGRPLFTARGKRKNQCLGHGLFAVGDVDGDGASDFVAGGGLPFPGSLPPGSTDLEAFSGRKGTPLFVVPSRGPDDLSQVSAAVPMGDWNGDGKRDIAVGASAAKGKAGAMCGAVRVLSGVEGKELARWEGKTEFDGLGAAVAAAGDRNADGQVDLWVFALGGEGLAEGSTKALARIDLVSGKDGSVLQSIRNGKSGEEIGQFLENAGDPNGDGVQDLLAGGPGSPLAVVYSGKDGAVLLALRPPLGK